ncbi:hypothetical protein EJ05DRAFT_399249 [Pseudovirgaria hyperparasitica]|uniref:Uncharacterized protein n=1 Tax=Pseudovirgaria hyperparasitica TaxID=470096 RepID=A0A6A6W6C4_9PEZI|nr:uncharacterized protein EJ05DRAFT_399249 [Pseudovirgaria hyperparasitica]KAF2757739.1 hypothetical protein EJ05DRAFT_399249 [Pseudovirgaria hyperparasitica]
MSDQLDRIYEGFWIDWSRQANDRQVLTLSPKWAYLFVAFLAVFVTWAAGHLWGIIQLIAHRCYSTRDPQDGLHHGRQAILRNSSTAGGSIWSLIHLFWSWKRRGHNVTLRSLPFLIVAILHLVGFTVAGIFSSRVTQTGGAVLLASRQCGIFDTAAMKHTSFAAAGDAVYQYTSALATSSSSWARSCYAQSDSDFSGGRGCAGFPKRTIGLYQRNTSATCPFEKSMCDHGLALSLDTGLISSEDFGMNTKPEERVWFRKITTWSPINTQNHTTTTTNRADLIGTEAEREAGFPGEMFTLYWLGNIDLLGHDVNWTFAASNFTGHYDSGYEIVPMAFYSGNPEFEWTPIRALARTDADITLIRKSNLVNYMTPVNDPWFRATIGHNDSRAEGTPLYKADEQFSVLAVTEQYQYCSSSDETQCSTLTGNYFGDFSEPAWDNFTDEQKDVLALLSEAAYFSNMRSLTYTLGREILLAHGFLLSLEVAVSVQLPDTQWLLEAENMHNTSLAIMQHKIVELPSPRNIATLSNGTVYHTSQFMSPIDKVSNGKIASAARLCGRIKVHDFEFASFSMLAIEIVLSLGGFIILLNCVLASIIKWISTRFDIGAYPMLEWIETGTLQLQRAVFELRGIVPWRKRLDAAPVTEKPEMRWVGIPKRQSEFLVHTANNELFPLPGDRIEEDLPGRLVVGRLHVPDRGASRIDGSISTRSGGKGESDSLLTPSHPETSLRPSLSEDPDIRGLLWNPDSQS